MMAASPHSLGALQTVQFQEGFVENLTIHLEIVDQEVAIPDHVADQGAKGEDQCGDTDDQGNQTGISREMG